MKDFDKWEYGLWNNLRQEQKTDTNKTHLNMEKAKIKKKIKQ